MFLDDLTPGFTWESGSRTLTEADILDFARQWDPQPFHTDPEAAKASAYGGLIASGFQTMVVAFTLAYAEEVWNEASMGSPGLDEVRWFHPVRPGDTLRVRAEVLDVTPSKSRPDRGRSPIRYDVFNQTDERVMTFIILHILARRP